MGDYISDSDLYSRWGKDNIDEWASLDNQTSPTAAERRATAIAWAEQYVEDRFRNGLYEVPFQFNGDGAKPVHDWMATLAGVWLYRTHGWSRGEDEKLDMMNSARKAVDDEIASYLAGIRTLDAERSFTGPTAPHV